MNINIIINNNNNIIKKHIVMFIGMNLLNKNNTTVLNFRMNASYSKMQNERAMGWYTAHSTNQPTLHVIF